MARFNNNELGQYGSAFLDADANVFVPPQGKVVVAIQCLGATEFDVLNAEDNTQWANRTEGAHGVLFDAVTTGVTAGTFVDLDGAVPDGIGVGDSVHYFTTGLFIAKIKSTGTDAAGNSDASVIELDRAVTVPNSTVISYATDTLGASGLILADNNVFPANFILYGRYTAVSLSGDQATDGVICYLGPATYPNSAI
tara:strand:+ start:40 stop:627 length:588 start_codon:yes stop_codon:yes gene_type:complete